MTADAFVAKFDPAGSALVYSTYLGGTGVDSGFGIAVDAAGNAYVTGTTRASNFPTTSGAFQPTRPSSTLSEAPFVTKLNAAGSALVYSTYLNGSSSDKAFAIDVYQGGNAYITGYTNSNNFPTTPGALQRTKPSLVDFDVFVTKLNPAGSALVYSTYLGGSNGGGLGSAIAIDGAGNAYVTGSTFASNFPTTAGTVQPTDPGTNADTADTFVTKLNATGTALVYSTYLSGTDGGSGNGIAVDGAGNAYVTGNTFGVKFPTTFGAFQPTNPDPDPSNSTPFVGKLNPAARPWSTPPTSAATGVMSGTGIAVDAAGNA